VCITAYQPNTESNPNPNPNPIPITKQHAIVSVQLQVAGGLKSKPLPNDQKSY